MLVVFSSLVERCLLRLRFDQLYRVLPGFQLRFRCFHHAKVHWIRMCNQIDNLRFKGQPFTGFSTGFFFRSSCQRDLKGPAALLIQAGDARGGGAVAGFLKRRRVALASRRQRHGDLRLVDVDGRCFGKRRSGGKWSGREGRPHRERRERGGGGGGRWRFYWVVLLGFTEFSSIGRDFYQFFYRFLLWVSLCWPHAVGLVVFCWISEGITESDLGSLHFMLSIKINRY